MSQTKVTSNVINDVDASKLTGSIADARIPASAVTQHVTGYDDANIRSDILKLALSQAVDGNRVAYNLENSFIDGFEDDTGITTETTVDRDADGEYVSSIYTSTTVTTPSSASDYTGDTGSYTLTSGGIDNTSGDDSIKSVWTATGDFVIQLTMAGHNNLMFGVYAIAEDGTFASNDRGGLQSMTNSFYWADSYGTDGTTAGRGGSFEGSFTKPADGSVMILRRVGSTITLEDDGTVLHTYSSGVTSEMRFASANAGPPLDGDIDNLTFTVSSTTVNATGTLISDAQTASSSRTSCSGVIIYEDSSGTATLGTDLEVYFTANNGTNWTEAASYGTATTYSGSKKLVKLGATTVTAGTQVAMKAVWANQASGSKETRLHGWAVNY